MKGRRVNEITNDRKAENDFVQVKVWGVWITPKMLRLLREAGHNAKPQILMTTNGIDRYQEWINETYP